MVAVAAALGLGVLAVVTVRKVNRSSQEANLQSNFRQLASAADQLFLEHPHRIFVKYAELVGPGHYIKAVIADTGADYHSLFPIRRDQTEFLDWTIQLSDGRVFAFRPQAEPKPDGVDVVRLPDGASFETTWRSGAGDGPFRAFYADGKPWGEAAYVKGRVVGPSWLFTRDGRKFDELADGEAAEQALDHQ